MNNLDQVAKDAGFEDWKELSKLVSSVNLSTIHNLNIFNYWKENDGTKKGLLKIIEEEK